MAIQAGLLRDRLAPRLDGTYAPFMSKLLLSGVPSIVPIADAKERDRYLTHTHYFRRFGAPGTPAEIEWKLDDLQPGEWSWKIKEADQRTRIVQFRCRRCSGLMYSMPSEIAASGLLRTSRGSARTCAYARTPKVRCSLTGYFVFDRFAAPVTG